VFVMTALLSDTTHPTPVANDVKQNFRAVLRDQEIAAGGWPELGRGTLGSKMNGRLASCRKLVNRQKLHDLA
jgi:hypothetical protein